MLTYKALNGLANDPRPWAFQSLVLKHICSNLLISRNWLNLGVNVVCSYFMLCTMELVESVSLVCHMYIHFSACEDQISNGYLSPHKHWSDIWYAKWKKYAVAYFSHLPYPIINPWHLVLDKHNAFHMETFVCSAHSITVIIFCYVFSFVVQTTGIHFHILKQQKPPW